MAELSICLSVEAFFHLFENLFPEFKMAIAQSILEIVRYGLLQTSLFLGRAEAHAPISGFFLLSFCLSFYLSLLAYGDILRLALQFNAIAVIFVLE